eukprot:NODE_2715_length_1055_cov_5745.169980_g2264_i0.p2 GENE.NODE_2715_length_1055_cov_5745.169980_g2264_i0~~NODE_2715_length_1055_cov_5745.169980_g2264_i0.p2  ORF type:complete len:302 (+),score=139.56 NODE_2715_length_1055_cov_5745.169980_g2264_i0:107-1012(+)
MVFIKVQKAAPYFKRFQVKPKRRRSGKTDYKARRALTQQAKNKYNTPKYRFVVRITNRNVICQFVYSKIVGDVVVCAAESKELEKKYGVKAGLTNYAACYATGLLCARRLLAKYGMADAYQGAKTADGKEFHVESSEDRRPFKAVLDIGLAKTTTGARIFGALKGAVDGGVDVPHSPKRFPGFAGGKLDSKVHRERIFGVHVGNYLNYLMENDTEMAQTQFGRYLKAGVNAKAVEPMWKDAHAKIRADPAPLPKKKFEGKPKAHNTPALTTAERLNIRNQRREAFKRKAKALAGDADSDEE